MSCGGKLSKKFTFVTGTETFPSQIISQVKAELCLCRLKYDLTGVVGGYFTYACQF